MNKNITYKNLPILELSLGTSLVLNVCCLSYIHQQNKRIDYLVENNISLVESINNLNSEVVKLGEDIAKANSAAVPLVINTANNGFFSKTLLIVALSAAGVGLTYYLGSTAVAKISSLSVSQFITLPKFLNFGYILGNIPLDLPFVEKKQEITVFLQDLSVSIFIELINGDVSKILFRPSSERNFRPIDKALEIYLNYTKENEIISAVPSLKIETLGETLNTISDILS